MKQRQFLPRPPRYRTNLLTTRLEHHGTVPRRQRSAFVQEMARNLPSNLCETQPHLIRPVSSRHFLVGV